jgi:hypothetical protein
VKAWAKVGGGVAIVVVDDGGELGELGVVVVEHGSLGEIAE